VFRRQRQRQALRHYQSAEILNRRFRRSVGWKTPSVSRHPDVLRITKPVFKFIWWTNIRPNVRAVNLWAAAVGAGAFVRPAQVRAHSSGAPSAVLSSGHAEGVNPESGSEVDSARVRRVCLSAHPYDARLSPSGRTGPTEKIASPVPPPRHLCVADDDQVDLWRARRGVRTTSCASSTIFRRQGYHVAGAQTNPPPRTSAPPPRI